jgi:hypothetical protein
MNLKKIGKVFTSKFVGTGPSSNEKKKLPDGGLTKVEKRWCRSHRSLKRELKTNTAGDFSPKSTAVVIMSYLTCWSIICDNGWRNGVEYNRTDSI